MKLPSCALPDLLVLTEAAPRKQFNINRNRCDEIIIRAAIMHGIQNEKLKSEAGQRNVVRKLSKEKKTPGNNPDASVKTFHLSSPFPRRAR